jgi:hypothetical protein
MTQVRQPFDAETVVTVGTDRNNDVPSQRELLKFRPGISMRFRVKPSTAPGNSHGQQSDAPTPCGRASTRASIIAARPFTSKQSAMTSSWLALVQRQFRGKVPAEAVRLQWPRRATPDEQS